MPACQVERERDVARLVVIGDVAHFDRAVDAELIGDLLAVVAVEQVAMLVADDLWGSRSRLERVTCRDRPPGMIAAVSLRLLYLIFSQLLNWLTLLPHASSSRDIELLVLRPEVAVFRRINPRPRLDWADRGGGPTRIAPVAHPSTCRADRTDGPRERNLGLPARPRRTPQARPPRRCIHHPQDPEAAADSSGAAASD